MPCKRCGKCCKMISMLYPRNPVTEAWAEARGGKVMQKSDIAILYRFTTICPQLKDNNVCKLQDNKPEACKVFPAPTMDYREYGLNNQHALPKGCGYRWDGEQYV